MKHIYLFNETDSNAAVFGIGRYIEQLTSCLKTTSAQVSVVRLFSKTEKVCVTYVDKVRYIDIPCLTPQTADKKRYCRSVAFILLPYISENEENLFHYNYLSTANLGIWLKQYCPMAEHVLTIHYREPQTVNHYVPEERFFKDVCNKIITFTPNAATSLCNDFQIPEEKIVIIPHALEAWNKSESLPSKNELKQEMGFSSENRILIYVGRLDANKNPQLLIDAFELLVDEMDDIHLIIVGKGNYEVVFSHIKHYGKITFTGFIDKKCLRTFYYIADIGIIPSRYEEFGYTALEMMMFGIPVIANRNHGLEAVVENRKTGILLDLYETDNEENQALLLAQTIKSLLSNPKKLKTYSINSKKRFTDKFKFSDYQSKMLELYNINK